MPEDFDFEALGFKCGLEIHQQILTQRKLFCRCPIQNRNDEPDISILRHMRPTLSEMGTYDGTALMEFKTKKNVEYQLFDDTVCTYEMDDTPPFPIDDYGLDVALELTMLFGCNVVDEIHVSRKQYLDGSIPAGFQRTAITGIEGEVPYKDGRKITIRQISIEEDSCREVSDKGHNIIFKTDRLGVPLIEVVTEPDIKHPREAADIASFLGRAMRATGKVRTGMGATRQDVNVSIRGGSRVEIKGVPKLQWMEALTANEARRQKGLLDIKEELAKRGVTEKTLETRKDIVTPIFAHTKWGPVGDAISHGGEAGAVLLRGFNGLLGWETQLDVPFLHEFMGRVRVIACLDETPNLLDLSALERVLKTDEFRELKRVTHWTKDDALILVWGPKVDVETAMTEIVDRAREACIGVPNETRQAFEDGTTTFERILPGPDRMYPDTDHPPVALSSTRLEEIRSRLREPSWNRETKCKELGISHEWAKRLSISPMWDTFLRSLDDGVDPKKAARALLVEGVYLRRKGIDLSHWEEDKLLAALALLKQPVPFWAWTKHIENGKTQQPTLASPEDVNKAVADIMNDGKFTFNGLVGRVLLKYDGWAPLPAVLEAAGKAVGA